MKYFYSFLLLLGCLHSASCSLAIQKSLEPALEQAGENRQELEAVLNHYWRTGQTQKLKAAHFLIENMPGQGFTELVFFTKDDVEVEYEALEYADYAEARNAFEKLAAEKGDLQYKSRLFESDLTHIKADFLITHIDLAFEAWRTLPWAKEMSWDTFREHILPYRGSGEPLGLWRRDWMDRIQSKWKDGSMPNDPQLVAPIIEAEANRLVGFREIFYLHPTDQSYSEMLERGSGRCEDMSNMITYGMRSNAVAVGQDYTPAWARGDNNHAWTTVLGPDGRGCVPQYSHAAKVYRKTYSIQPDAPALHKADDEELPRWLSGTHFTDVTDQYMETNGVELPVSVPSVDNHVFGHMAVFNGGRWIGIAAGRIQESRESVRFDLLGRNVCYLPSWKRDGNLVPFHPPILIRENGEVNILDGSEQKLTVVLTVLRPEAIHVDKGTIRPELQVKEGKNYELFYWDDTWHSLGQKAGGKDPVSFEDVPANRLYWLVEEGSRRLERIFTVESGAIVHW